MITISATLLSPFDMRKIDTGRFIYIRLVHKATAWHCSRGEDERVFQRPPLRQQFRVETRRRYASLPGEWRCHIFVLFAIFRQPTVERARCSPILTDASRFVYSDAIYTRYMQLFTYARYTESSRSSGSPWRKIICVLHEDYCEQPFLRNWPRRWGAYKLYNAL